MAYRTSLILAWPNRRGLSRDDTLAVSSTGQVMGTIAYMSPEQADGRPNQVDARSDVFSLGVVLYEMLTMKLPYDLDTSLVNQLSAIAHEQPDLVSLRKMNPSQATVAIVARALEKEPEKRYRNAIEMGDDILRNLRGKQTDAESENRALTERRRWVRRDEDQRRWVFSHLRLSWLGGLTIAIAITACFAVSQWIVPGPRPLMPPLRPLANGEFFSADDLEGQIDTLQDFLRRGDNLSSVSQEIVERFHWLEAEHFESLDPQDSLDLSKMKSLASFLDSRPSKDAVAPFRSKFWKTKEAGNVDSSGPVNDVMDRILRLLAESSDSEFGE